jgi:hypothetical protein
VAAALGLDVVERDDDVGWPVEERLPQGRQPRSRRAAVPARTSVASMWKLLMEGALPLLGEVRAGRGRRCGGSRRGRELTGDQAGLDGLADADVVGDEQADGAGAGP